MAEQARPKVAHYLNTTPDETGDTFSLIGDGVSALQMSMNPKTSEEHYIHNTNATQFVDGYAPSIDLSQIVYPGDEVFDFVDAIRQTGDIGLLDLTELVEVRLYEDPDTAGTSYPASKWNIQIAISDAPGGDGGGRANIGYQIVIKGDLTDGDFNTSTLAFT